LDISVVVGGFTTSTGFIALIVVTLLLMASTDFVALIVFTLLLMVVIHESPFPVIAGGRVGIVGFIPSTSYCCSPGITTLAACIVVQKDDIPPTDTADGTLTTSPPPPVSFPFALAGRPSSSAMNAL
jgi:Na+/serine symporter